VQVAGEAYGGGTGRSKKEAEQEAAAAAWRHLRAELPDDAADDLDGAVTGV
jgi:ribonuclease III